MEKEKFTLEKIELKSETGMKVFKMKFKNSNNEINIKRYEDEFDENIFLIGKQFDISYKIDLNVEGD